MTCEPYWIVPMLAIVPRPRGGDWLQDEMVAMRAAGIDVVLSTVETAEARELGLQQEEAEARSAGIQFVSFPIPDRGTPADMEAFDRLLQSLEQAMLEGKRVGVHCRGCIGRSSVIAASLLVRSGTKHVDAWRQIGNARGTSVPDTAEQRAWVETHIGKKPWHRI